MITIKEFYNPNTESDSLSDNIKGPSVLDFLTDFSNEIFSDSFYGDRQSELQLVLDSWAIFETAKYGEFANEVALALSNEFVVGTSRAVAIDVYTNATSVVGLSIDNQIIFGNSAVKIYQSTVEDLSNPRWGRYQKRTFLGRADGSGELSLSNPSFVAKLLRAIAKVHLGGEFSRSSDLSEAIDRYNDRQGDAMLDDGYRQIRDRLEGREGWRTA